MKSLSKACKQLIEDEGRLFHEEYNRFCIDGESKPRTIGEPFLLKNQNSRTGILLIHGLMAAPEEVREWAEDLFSKGFSVYAPRLAGHGTSPEDLANREYHEWSSSVDRGYKALKQYCDKIVIAGFSTGAGLALYHAIEKPSDFEAVISISAPFRFKGNAVRCVEALHHWNLVCKKLSLHPLVKEYVKNHPDNPHINYQRCPINSLVEVRALMKAVAENLKRLSVPALIIQGKNDPKVDDRSGKDIYDRIVHKDKTYTEIDYHLHGIVRGNIASKVFEETGRFLDRFLS